MSHELHAAADLIVSLCPKKDKRRVKKTANVIDDGMATTVLTCTANVFEYKKNSRVKKEAIEPAPQRNHDENPKKPHQRLGPGPLYGMELGSVTLKINNQHTLVGPSPASDFFFCRICTSWIMEQRWLHNDYVQAMAGGTAEKALRQLLERQLEQAKAGCNLRQILEAQLAIEELDRRNDRNERQLLERQVEREREERAKEGVGGPAGVLYKEIDNIGRRGKEQCARAVDERRAQAVRQQLAQMGFAGTDADAALLRACDYGVARVLDRLVEGGAASACSPSAAALRAPRRTRSPRGGQHTGAQGATSWI